MTLTLEKFGYPDTCVKEYEHWAVLLRPQQVTLGSLVLVEKSPATSYGDISVAAMAEQKQIAADIEQTLKTMFGAEKFNYMMLMMVDPNVHFHVIPRYSAEKEFAGVKFADTGWPKLPDMAHRHELTDPQREELLTRLRQNWSQGSINTQQPQTPGSHNETL